MAEVKSPGVDETRNWAKWQLKAPRTSVFLRVAWSGRAFSPVQSLDWAPGDRKRKALMGSFEQSACSVLICFSEIGEGLGVVERSTF